MSHLRRPQPSVLSFRFSPVLLLLVLVVGLGFGPEAAAQPPSEIGQWGQVIPFPYVAIHLVLFHTGKVMFWADTEGEVSLWNPAAGPDAFITIPNASNMFCCGQTLLADGRLFTIGGELEPFFGLRDTNIFDPETESWSLGGDMNFPRWYPTATTLADGRVLAVSGLIDIDPEPSLASIPEVYDVQTGVWTALPDAELFLPPYSFLFVIPDGRVFNAGGRGGAVETSLLDVDAPAWSFVGLSSFGGASSAMYRPGMVLKSGDVDDQPTNDAAIIDMNAPFPQWSSVPSMQFARGEHNLTLLPDGRVVAIGGSEGQQVAVLEAEMWDPDTLQWTLMATMAIPRMHHSTAVLLPDARVLSAGGDDFPNAQMYSPPYLFRGPRPSIAAAPSAIAYGLDFTVDTPQAATIESVVLIRPGAVTHGFDHSQRFVELAFSASDDALSVEAPAHSALAPPGYYMLFILNQDEIPSVAEFVLLHKAFVRGDVNGDGVISLGDALYLLEHLFLGGPAPSISAAADVDDNGVLSLVDAFYILNFLFLEGPPPPPPYPDPGTDPTP